MSIWSRSIVRNAGWLLISLLLSLSVWYVATIQADPIEERRFSRIPIQFSVPEDLVVTNSPTSTVVVEVRAQQSVLNVLTSDDIIVTADLMGLGEGWQSVPLEVDISRPASADTQPRQITVELSSVVSQLKPVELEVLQEPPADMSYAEPVLDVVQALVTGAGADVQRVDRLVARVNLVDRRRPIRDTVSLVPVDAEERIVSDVTVEPETAEYFIDIYQRDDVKTVSIRPSLLMETLGDGYSLRSIEYTPQTVFISGSSRALAQVGDTITTGPITLKGRTGDFSVDVPLIIEPADVSIIGDVTSVQVTVGIDAQIGSQQVDGIVVEVSGLDDDEQVTLSPQTISVVFNGPLDVVRQIRAADVLAVVDLSAFDAGTYEVVPAIVVDTGDVTVDAATPLPATISVTIALSDAFQPQTP